MEDTNITEQFIEKIHGKDSLIYFNVGNVTWNTKPQTYSDAKDKLKWLNERKDKDICFIVNSGGSKDAQITGINACFIDCGVFLEVNVPAAKP